MPIDENGFIHKGATIEKSTADETEMGMINKLTLEKLGPDDVYTFRVVMCDNKIDRDYEAFDEIALSTLGELFVGKTVIKDHNHRADNQIGRIYATEVVRAGGLSDTGEDYMQLVAKCYMLANESSEKLAADIKGGIKKEVSVGFSAGSATCSVCGSDNMKTYCDHWNGREYEGQKCWFKFGDIRDAYELSFVAVPAQRAAGAIKAYGLKPPEEKPPEKEKEFDEEHPPSDKIEKELDMKMRLSGAFLFAQKQED